MPVISGLQCQLSVDCNASYQWTTMSVISGLQCQLSVDYNASYQWTTELILGFFPEGANSPLVFPKGGQPANQMGNGVFLKKTKTLPTTPSSLKKHCRPFLHPLKKLSPHLRKNRAGVVLRRWPVLFTPNHNNPGLQKCWEKTGYGEEWEGYLI